MQRSPAEPYPAPISPSTAWSMSASGMMMAWFLAPPETLAALPGLRRARVDVLRDRCGADEPNGLDVGIAQDGVHRFLVAIHHVQHTWRQSGLQEQLSNAERHRGVALGRLKDHRIAASQGGASLPQWNHSRKVEWRDAGHDTQGLTHGVDIDARARTVGILTLEKMRDTDRELHHLQSALDIALGIGDRFAVLAGQQGRQRILLPGDQFKEFHQHAGAALRIGRRPTRLRRPGILHRRAKLRLACQRHLGLHCTSRRVVHIGEASACPGDGFPTDEMSDFTHHGCTPPLFPRMQHWHVETCMTMVDFAPPLCVNPHMVQQFDWNALQSFLAVVRAGRLTAAAKQLGVDHSTLSRRITELERSLQVRLFDRQPSGYTLTPQGEALLDAAQSMETTALGILTGVAGSSLKIAGTVRIGAPDGFGTRFLGPRLGKLGQAHPDLQIQLVTLPRLFSLSKREADIAIGLAPPAEGRLHARKLTNYQLGLYGSHTYLQQHEPILRLTDLKEHRFIG